MWRLKNKLIPKELDPPMGKLDESGNLITAPSALKKLYLDHYAARLKHRKIDTDYEENYMKKVNLWKLRFEKVKSTKSENWTNADLKKALILENKQNT